MVLIREPRVRKVPPSGDFVCDAVVTKRKKPPASALPKQWPATKRPKVIGSVATIDNVTLMNELNRRGLLAPEMQARPLGTRWNREEDARLEEAVATWGTHSDGDVASPWHAIAQHVGMRSNSACLKRWKLLHPDALPVLGCESLPKKKDNSLESLQLDMLLATDPAEEHYGLMALEEFTDTDTDGDSTAASPPSSSSSPPLASYRVPGMLTSNPISFAFPKAPRGTWDKRRLEEHYVLLHQQRVTATWLEMRAKGVPALDPSVFV